MHETRSAGPAVAETVVFTSSLLSLIAVPLLIIGMVQSPDAAVRVASDAGDVLLEHVGWTLSGYIAVLLGFYVVVIGGQIFGGGKAAGRVRRLLGGVAELIAAAAIALVVMVAVYCVGAPRNWWVFVAVLPTASLIFFLAVQLGRFMIPDRAFRLEEARGARAATRLRLRGLSRRSRLPFTVVWAATAAGLATAAMLAALIASASVNAVFPSVPETAFVLALYFVMALFLLAWNAFATYATELDRSRANRLLFVLMSAFIYGAVLLLCWPSLTAVTGWLVWPVVGIAAAAVVCTVLPAATQGWPTDWSFRGAVNRVVARRLARAYAQSVRTILSLEAATRAEPVRAADETRRATPVPLFQRLLDMLNHRD
jgi:hypothetical protein